MTIERQVVSYLMAYGNTSEHDLISYGVHNFARPPEKMKKIIDRMAIEGKIHRIVHNKLQPPEVYISLEESVPTNLMMQKQIDNYEAREILEEAAWVAERRSRDRSQ